MLKRFNSSLFISLVLCYFIAFVLGIFSYQFGKSFAVKHYGINLKYCYSQLSWDDTSTAIKYVCPTATKYRNEIDKHLPFPDSDKFYDLSAKAEFRTFEIILYANMFTVFIACIGLCFLLYNLSIIKNRATLTVKHWIYVFATLFWSKEFILSSLSLLLLFQNNTDKVDWMDWSLIFNHLKINNWFGHSVLFVISFLVLLFVLFRVIPKHQRVTFIIATIVGCPLSYFMWLKVLGPVLLPIPE